MDHTGEPDVIFMNLRFGQARDNATPIDDLIEKVVGDRYRIVNYVGGGGFGRVYRAVHLELNQTVAVKVLHAGFVFDETTYRRFKQEATVLASVIHPNVCRVLDFFVLSDGRPTIVMEFVDGVNLSKRLETGPLPLKSCLNLGIQLAQALVAAQASGLVHRDIKPGNIVISDETVQTVKLLDFGLVKLVGPQHASSLTQTGGMVGTPGYMSPEQCLGREVDERADIYSVGCVLYEAACGQPAFSGNSLFEIINAHLKRPPASLVSRLSAQTNAEMKMVKLLSMLVDKCIHRDLAHRYQSAGQLVDDFAAIKDGRTTTLGNERSYNQYQTFSKWIICAVCLAVSVTIAIIYRPDHQNYNKDSRLAPRTYHGTRRPEPTMSLPIVPNEKINEKDQLEKSDKILRESVRTLAEQSSPEVSFLIKRFSSLMFLTTAQLEKLRHLRAKASIPLLIFECIHLNATSDAPCMLTLQTLTGLSLPSNFDTLSKGEKNRCLLAWWTSNKDLVDAQYSIMSSTQVKSICKFLLNRLATSERACKFLTKDVTDDPTVYFDDLITGILYDEDKDYIRLLTGQKSNDQSLLNQIAVFDLGKECTPALIELSHDKKYRWLSARLLAFMRMHGLAIELQDQPSNCTFEDRLTIAVALGHANESAPLEWFTQEDITKRTRIDKLAFLWSLNKGPYKARYQMAAAAKLAEPLILDGNHYVCAYALGICAPSLYNESTAVHNKVQELFKDAESIKVLRPLSALFKADSVWRSIELGDLACGRLEKEIKKPVPNVKVCDFFAKGLLWLCDPNESYNGSLEAFPELRATMIKSRQSIKLWRRWRQKPKELSEFWKESLTHYP